jgi:hypothetical protein
MIQELVLIHQIKTCIVETQNGRIQERSIIKINGTSLRKMNIVTKEISITKINLIIMIKMHIKAKYCIEF